MSTIPSSAMPHAFVDGAGPGNRGKQRGDQSETTLPTGLLVAGAAIAGYLLLKLLR